MSSYVRPRVPGACVFFTVNLVDRGADTLVRHVGLLRQAVAVTRAKRPFAIDAWVVLPDHMHCVWTLPEGDSDYSGRMSEIKARFTRELRSVGACPDALAPEFVRGAGWTGQSRGRPRPTGRSARLAEAVLGASHPGRGGFGEPCPVLLDQPGEARLGRASAGVAVVVVAPRCGWGGVVGRGLPRHRESGQAPTYGSCQPHKPETSRLLSRSRETVSTSFIASLSLRTPACQRATVLQILC
ncbi:REP-associated tyrosine transposase [Tabrizicola soli]|uniref:REP-associated tyrosine transposase n=1 Tax=Tabrizicola soli TaxID=2185115 RepID=UPI003AA91CDC